MKKAFIWVLVKISFLASYKGRILISVFCNDYGGKQSVIQKDIRRSPNTLEVSLLDSSIPNKAWQVHQQHILLD